MKTCEIILAVAAGVILAKTCCNKPACPPAPPVIVPPCKKCVYKRYYGCKD